MRALGVRNGWVFGYLLPKIWLGMDQPILLAFLFIFSCLNLKVHKLLVLEFAGVSLVIGMQKTFMSLEDIIANLK